MITKMLIIVPLGVKEMLEWYNSFVLLLKSNYKVWISTDQAKLN